MKRKLSLSARIYRFLTRLYPSDFRWHYEPELHRCFDESEREQRGRPWGWLRLWAAMLLDFVRTLPREHADMLAQDIRFTLRSLRRSPGFSSTAVLTLALAIAANSVIFSTVHAVLLRPLPYQEPEQLVLLRVDLPRVGLFDTWLSEPEFMDLRQRSRLFSEFALFRSERVNFKTEQSVEPLTAGIVSANFLDFLGLRPELGRSFVPEEELPNGPAVVLFSHDFWRNRFGGDPNVVGQTVQLDGRSVSVLGVAPAGFEPEFPARTRLPSDVDLWLPYQVDYQQQDRHSHGVTVFGRMRPGVSLDEVQQELDAVAEHLREPEYAKTGLDFKALPWHLDLTSGVRPTLLALLAAVGVVLLITCTNIANLLLARNSVRSREIAVRAAVGARATRLARQIFTESLVLSFIGGGLGIALSYLSLPLLISFSPAGIPGLENVQINGPVLGFSLACCLAAALVFSLAPCLQSTRQNRSLYPALVGRQSGPDSGFSLRRVLIVAEVALAFVLLIAGGLLFQTLEALRQEDPGFDPNGVLTLDIALPSSSYGRDQLAPFFEELETRIRNFPGVVAVGSNMQLPLSGSSWSGTDTFYETTNRAVDGKEHFEVDQRVITADYFRTLGTRLLSGRSFSSADSRNSRPVIIIDETLAERVWPGADPIGKRMARGADPEEPFFFEVIGVVEHQRYQDLRSDGRPQVYYAQSQLRFNALSLAVRASVSPLTLLDPIRGELQAMDPELPIASFGTLDEAVAAALAPTRFTLTLLALFAGIGLLLAGIGIFGIVNYSVGQRTQEIAIRMAMGARPEQVVAATLRQALLLVLSGMLIGGLVSLGVGSALESLLFGVSARDATTFAMVALLFLTLSLVAALLPALRATRVNPARTLQGAT